MQGIFIPDRTYKKDNLRRINVIYFEKSLYLFLISCHGAGRLCQLSRPTELQGDIRVNQVSVPNAFATICIPTYRTSKCRMVIC